MTAISVSERASRRVPVGILLYLAVILAVAAALALLRSEGVANPPIPPAAGVVPAPAADPIPASRRDPPELRADLQPPQGAPSVSRPNDQPGLAGEAVRAQAPTKVAPRTDAGRLEPETDDLAEDAAAAGLTVRAAPQDTAP